MPEDVQVILRSILTDNVFQKQFLRALEELVKEDEAFKRQLVSVLDVLKDKKRKGRLSLFSNLNTVAVIQVVVSVLLIMVFSAYVYLTFTLVQTQPEGIMVGGHMEMFDPFARARDLLTLIIPVFATVVSFWLGFSIQERKVNQAEQMADKQRAMREKSDKMMAKVEGMTMILPESEIRDQLHQLMQDR